MYVQKCSSKRDIVLASITYSGYPRQHVCAHSEYLTRRIVTSHSQNSVGVLSISHSSVLFPYLSILYTHI